MHCGHIWHDIWPTSFPGSLFSASLGRWKGRPWLRLVTWPPRIRLVKKSIGRKGWQSQFCLLLWETSRLSKPRADAKNYPLYFCRLQNKEDLRSQRNSAAEWSTHFLTVKCHVQNLSETSGSISWIFECAGKFLLCVVVWLLKSTSDTRPLTECNFWIAFVLQQCKMIHSFVDISPHLYFICIRFM